jgi:hypothetical protein
MKRNNYNRDEVIDNYKTWRGILTILSIVLLFLCNNLWKDYKYSVSEANQYLNDIKTLTDENIILKKKLDSLKRNDIPEIKKEIVKPQKVKKIKKQEVKENKVEQSTLEQPVVLSDTLR